MELNQLASFLRDTAQGASNSVAGMVSGPVDLGAWAMRKAGVPVGNAPVGGSTWMAQKGITRQPLNMLASGIGEFGGMMLPFASGARTANALIRGGENLAARRTLNPQTGAVVWHGSPHKFDKFDSSKIGTGEGAQAYGHGIYTAEAPDVARQYADNVKDMGYVQDVNARMSELVKLMDPHRGAEYGKFKTPEGYALKAEYDRLMDARSARLREPGNLYKVDLPDEQIAKMLDWDKPLSQQAPEVRAAMSKAQQKFSQLGIDPAASRALQSMEDIGYVTDKYGRGMAGVSEYLRAQGIPGIRYLDGGSRGAGQGSSNYVVFPGNENLLSILERNGQALK